MISEEFKKFELVVPGWGIYNIRVRKAGESILKTGPVVIDAKAVAEMSIDREDALKLIDALDRILKRDNKIVAMYLRTVDDE